MHTFYHIFGISLPSYGSLIVLGALVANLIAIFIIKRAKLDINDFIILEAYALLGAFVGSKGLYLIIGAKDIDWSRFFEPAYFNSIMLGGFVFYGGLILAVAFVFLAGKLHKVNAFSYVSQVIGLVPLAHGFGRIGCFMAGCCYGVPYEGPLAVTFPQGSYAIAGVSLFPVQLVEAICLFAISAVIMFLQLRFRFKYQIELYIFLYGVVRFILEMYRYDAVRGRFGLLYTSQWISIIMLIIAVIMFIFRRKIKREVK